jgi:hypothetical protein
MAKHQVSAGGVDNLVEKQDAPPQEGIFYSAVPAELVSFVFKLDARRNYYPSTALPTPKKSWVRCPAAFRFAHPVQLLHNDYRSLLVPPSSV